MSLFNDRQAFVGVDEVRTSYRRLAVALLAEFLGTAFIVIIGCGSTRFMLPATLQVAMCFGLTVGAAVLCFGPSSGGHLNPAVTLGFLVAGRVPLIRSALYIVVQCVGAITGAALLRAFSPEALKNELGVTKIDPALTSAQAFGIETLITFLLVLTVFAATDDDRTDISLGFVSLAVGLVITGCHLFAVVYTGSSMNPARSFGPAVITNSWNDHWVYWVGPILGGVIAGPLYQFVLKATSDSSPEPPPPGAGN